MIINEPENIMLTISDSTKEHLKRFFGEEVPEGKLAALVGALDEAVVEITPLGDGFLSTARHRYLIEQTRIRGSAADFGLFITNEFFSING